MQTDPAIAQNLLQFLRGHDVAVVATVRENGTPHAATVYYYVDEKLRLYFLTKDQTSKFTNLKKNTSIAVVISDQQLLQTVQVEGVAKEVDYAHEYAAVVKEFTDNLAKNGKPWEQIPFNHFVSGYYVFVQVTPTWIRWSDFKDWGHTVRFEQHFS